MTIDQQPSDTLRDRFDRATEGPLPTPDLAAAITGGRRRRRLRATSYAVGSLAVAAVAASAFVVPRLDAPQTVSVAGPASEVDFVAGTTIDTDLAAAVAGAEPSLPAPTDVYPGDLASASDGSVVTTELPDEEFATAEMWYLVYDVGVGNQVTVMVTKPGTGSLLRSICPTDRAAVEIETPERDEPLLCEDIVTPARTIVHSARAVGPIGSTEGDGERPLSVEMETLLTATDGHNVMVIEHIDPSSPVGRTLTGDQREVIAQAPGLDFPQQVEASPAP